eukprot:gene16383-22584_t
MADREARLQQIREQKSRWMRERQSEIDRTRVVAELGGTPPVQMRNVAPLPQQKAAAPPPQQHQPSSSTAPSMRASRDTNQYAGNMGVQQHSQHQPQQFSPQQHRPQQYDQQHQQYWENSGVRPEQVIDRLTEKIADRMREELKLELQRESECWQQQQQQQLQQHNAMMDDYLAKELETQNTCPICYDLMVPPDHAPQLLFPCGHTFCSTCIATHMDKLKKIHCPVCRKQIESRAPNYSLQQLILNFVNKKGQQRQSAVGVLESPLSPSGSHRSADKGAAGQGSDADRLRRQAERIAVRIKVLRNELVDTINENDMRGKVANASLTLESLRDQEAHAQERVRAAKAQLEGIRQAMEVEQRSVSEVEEEAAAVRSRRDLLSATLEPLESEAEKLEVLLMGASEMEDFD